MKLSVRFFRWKHLVNARWRGKKTVESVTLHICIVLKQRNGPSTTHFMSSKVLMLQLKKCGLFNFKKERKNEKKTRTIFVISLNMHKILSKDCFVWSFVCNMCMYYSDYGEGDGETVTLRALLCSALYTTQQKARTFPIFNIFHIQFLWRIRFFIV